MGNIESTEFEGGFNRRKFPRADLVFDLDYRQEDNKPVTTFSRDISSGGVSFQTHDLYSQGAVLELIFSASQLPRSLKTIGRVVRSWNDGATNYTAVEFLEVSEDDLSIIREYIEPS